MDEKRIEKWVGYIFNHFVDEAFSMGGHRGEKDKETIRQALYAVHAEGYWQGREEAIEQRQVDKETDGVGLETLYARYNSQRISKR